MFITPYAKGIYFHISNPSPIIWNGIVFHYNLRTKYTISNDNISFVDVIAEPAGSATALKVEDNGWIKNIYFQNSTQAMTSTINYFKNAGYNFIKEENCLVLDKIRTFIILEKNNEWLVHTFIPEKNIILHYTGDPSGYEYLKYIFLTTEYAKNK